MAGRKAERLGLCFSAALRFCGRVKGESGGRCERILQCCEREVPSGAEILHLQEKKVNPAQLQKTILQCMCGVSEMAELLLSYSGMEYKNNT